MRTYNALVFISIESSLCTTNKQYAQIKYKSPTVALSKQQADTTHPQHTILFYVLCMFLIIGTCIDGVRHIFGSVICATVIIPAHYKLFYI